MLNTIAEFYLSQPFIQRYLVPFLGCVLLYAVFRKRREFSLHAIQNTFASVVVFWANLALVFVLYEDVAHVISRIYAALHIPAIDPAIWASLPLWLLCIIGVVVNDFVYYWTHRLMHTRWGWPTHAAHHSDTHVNAFTAYRVHFLEWLTMACSYFFLLTWMSMPEAIPLVILFTSLHSVYVHMDLPFTHGPLKHVLASPAYHRWHHADVPEAYGKNLANIIPLWDNLFGTHYTYEVVPDVVPMGAPDTGVADKNPIQILIYPILEWSRLARDVIRDARAIITKKARRRPRRPLAFGSVGRGRHSRSNVA